MNENDVLFQKVTQAYLEKNPSAPIWNNTSFSFIHQAENIPSHLFHICKLFASFVLCCFCCFSICLVDHKSCFVAGARNRQQLLTIFALTNKYQASDVALAVSSKLHFTAFQMCQGSLLTIQPSSYQKTQLGNTFQLPVILQVASFRLLQLIAVTTGSVCYFHFFLHFF